jgi:hypothetical protein
LITSLPAAWAERAIDRPAAAPAAKAAELCKKVRRDAVGA